MKLTGSPRCLFVYGTLRRGECNHILLRAAPFLGQGRTAGRYTLFNLGRYPAAMAGGRTAIVGEVYALNKALLARLDRLEDYPREFVRTCIATPYGPAWIYLYQRPPAPETPVILSGDWRLARRLRSSTPPLCSDGSNKPWSNPAPDRSDVSALRVIPSRDRPCLVTMNHPATDYFAKSKMAIRPNLY